METAGLALQLCPPEGLLTSRPHAESLAMGSVPKLETKAQESGKKVATIHGQLPAVIQLTAQFIRTIRTGTFFECDGRPLWHLNGLQ